MPGMPTKYIFFTHIKHCMGVTYILVVMALEGSHSLAVPGAWPCHAMASFDDAMEWHVRLCSGRRNMHDDRSTIPLSYCCQYMAKIDPSIDSTFNIIPTPSLEKVREKRKGCDGLMGVAKPPRGTPTTESLHKGGKGGAGDKGCRPTPGNILTGHIGCTTVSTTDKAAEGGFLGKISLWRAQAAIGIKVGQDNELREDGRQRGDAETERRRSKNV
eukprot:Gb_21341 [translate_table: standard]